MHDKPNSLSAWAAQCQLVIPLDDRYDFELLIDDEMVVAALDDARFGLRALSSGDEGASGTEK
jgi:hypothetical protein